MFLLGLLGITFYIGSRPQIPRAAEQPVVRNHSWASTTADASTRVPTLSRDRFRSDPGTVTGQPSAASTGIADNGARRAYSAETSIGREVSWIIHAETEGAVEPKTNAPASQVPVRQPILGSEQSLRERWQAGPGNESNPQQVKLKGVMSDHVLLREGSCPFPPNCTDLAASACHLQRHLPASECQM